MSEQSATAPEPDNAQLVTLVSSLLQRRELASRLGQQFDGDRNLYTVLGYKTDLNYVDFEAAYERGDIARRIVDAPAEATWRRNPIVQNDSDPDNFTEFETAWASLAKRLRIFHYLERVDRLSGIGEYGILLIGSADAREEADMARPLSRVRGPKDIKYLAPFTQKSATIAELNTDPSSERFGLPALYEISVESDGNTSAERGKTKTLRVHWSRVIHIAEKLGEDDIYGTPRLKVVFNRLNDMDKIGGGSAEIFWQAAKRIMVLEAMEGYNSQDNDERLTEQMEELVHGLRRVIDVQGYNVNSLPPTDVKPEEAFKVCASLISSATGIPQRILFGSEQGKLAAEQDEDNWNGKIKDRQENHAEPIILRPLIDRLISVGALPTPGEDYFIEWPSLFEMSDKEKAAVSLLKIRALDAYTKNVVNGITEIVPVDELRSILNLKAPKAGMDPTSVAIVPGTGAQQLPAAPDETEEQPDDKPE